MKSFSRILKYLGDQKFYNGFVSQKDLGNLVEMTFLTQSLQGFARWYMLFGECAEIVTPKKLIETVKQNLATLSKKLK